MFTCARCNQRKLMTNHDMYVARQDGGRDEVCSKCVTPAEKADADARMARFGQVMSAIYTLSERRSSDETTFYCFGNEKMPGGAHRLFAVVTTEDDGFSAHLGREASA